MSFALSAVMAYLYVATLMTDRYKWILGRGCSWWKYVDNILVTFPKETNVGNKLRMLNTVDEHMQFTVKLEANRKILRPLTSNDYAQK